MDGKKLKVLVVDDEKIIRDFFRRLLSLLNLEVAEAEDGYKAVELAGKEKFDIFFVDVRMPGMNGLDTYRKIRQIDPKANVIMMTGYAVEDLLDAAKREGVDGSIRKPFEINQIKDIVDVALKKDGGKKLSILVIDDEKTVFDFLSTLLQDKGAQCKFAQNKPEALSLVKSDKFDLIFLDLILQDSYGIDIYREIKKIVPDASIVLITGHPQKAKELEGQIEVIGSLHKPFDIESVISCVEGIRAKS
jgi:two-component system, NtrC family, response regulator HydG